MRPFCSTPPMIIEEAFACEIFFPWLLFYVIAGIAYFFLCSLPPWRDTQPIFSLQDRPTITEVLTFFCRATACYPPPSLSTFEADRRSFLFFLLSLEMRLLDGALVKIQG